ncbi:MAG TPA: M23 family metallopeptidase [Thermoanaerobaculia bacterium]|nr:M23 family metallopeptidase [Thermoanaerobaculia bacterium]
MELLPLFVLSVIMPLVTSALLWHRPRQPRAGWVTTLLLAIGVNGFSQFVAPWGFFGLPLRIALILLFAAALVRSLRRPIDEERMAESPLRHMVKVLIGFFFGSVAMSVLSARSVPPGVIDLKFPLTGGTFLVAHGGSHPAANLHGRDEKGQRFGLDITRLNAAGTRASGLFPRDLDRYAIFGTTVVSPCDGTVIAAVDGLVDNAPGTRDEQRKEGNHAIVRCGDVDVTLAHLQKGSVVVRPGTQIAAGAPVGKVGNSGNTTEPHLHVHAERKAVAVPARFDGRWLVRNSLIRR